MLSQQRISPNFQLLFVHLVFLRKRQDREHSSKIRLPYLVLVLARIKKENNQLPFPFCMDGCLFQSPKSSLGQLSAALNSNFEQKGTLEKSISSAFPTRYKFCSVKGCIFLFSPLASIYAYSNAGRISKRLSSPPKCTFQQCTGKQFSTCQNNVNIQSSVRICFFFFLLESLHLLNTCQEFPELFHKLDVSMIFPGKSPVSLYNFETQTCKYCLY